MPDSPNSAATERLLTEAVGSMRDLCGSIIDMMPPQTQGDIANVQVKLLLAQKASTKPSARVA